MLRRLPEDLAKIYLVGTGYTLREMDYEKTELPFAEGCSGKRWLKPHLQLVGAFSTRESQEFPSLLRRLADYAEARIADPKRDHRPSRSNADARALARDLARYFLSSFHKVPNEIIAACVRLYFPNLDDPPDEGTIREWRGVKRK